VYRFFVLLVTAALTGPAAAQAATYCVGLDAPGCERRSTVASAFDAAAASDGPDTILLGGVTETGTFSDGAGEPVRVVGEGRGATQLVGTLELDQAGSSVARLTAGALRLGGGGRDLRVLRGAELRGATLQSAVVGGAVVTTGEARMESVAVTDAVDVRSGALTAGHLTVLGSGPVGVRVATGASARVANSIVWGFARPFEGSAAVSHSHHDGADPAFVAPPADLRLRADSPLVDAGDPSPLGSGEPHEDAMGDVRAVDGDGDGTARRDVGALERRPPAPPPTDGNLLTNPGAEQGEPARDDRESPAVPGWRRTGAFTSVRYGTVAGGFPFPTGDVADALGAGRAFFAGGPGGAATLTQVVDVSSLAPEIDLRTGAVTLSALLGGYRQSPDAAHVQAEFRSPTGAPLRSVALDTVTPEERAHATMLAPRAAAARIPQLTRTIAVTLTAPRPGGAYNDAYADDVALVPRVPPFPGAPPVRLGRPFSGVAVLARRATVDRRGRAWVRVGCARRTVRRCRGVLTLTRKRSIVIGSRRFALDPGRVRRVGVRLRATARRRLRGRPGRFGGHVYSASRDGQGATRTRTAPVRFVRRVRRRG
jgi:hypothetical protein